MNSHDSAWSELMKEAVHIEQIAAQVAEVLTAAVEPIQPLIGQASHRMLQKLQAPDTSWVEFSYNSR